MRRHRPFAALLACLCLAAAGAASPAETAAIATLRIEPADGEYLAWADNRLAGPIEVRLSGDGDDALTSDPALPARASVAAGGSSLVARLKPAGGSRGLLRLRLSGVPGSSNARPADVEYLPPLQAAGIRIDQGFEGSFSHADDQNRYALDFATAVGTPVLAARGGTVMQVEAGFRASTPAQGGDAARANFVRILHDDGSMALYAHLAHDGALVGQGQQVRAGQHIGLSGNTGYSTAPHLHFVVQANRGGRLLSIPFRMRGVPTGAPQRPPVGSGDDSGNSASSAAASASMPSRW